MCGIAGLLAGPEARVGPLGPLAQRMAGALRHRGPDDEGLWTEDPGIALAHRRLSILDLTPAGRQPMVCAGGRWALVLNGEIYNHSDLRASLPAVQWRGRSDTEALLEAIAALGVAGALSLAEGMFAFAAWDRAERTLWLARDRYGEKPLHYAFSGGVFRFGSELKALRAAPDGAVGIDPQALSLYLRLGWIPAPWTIDAGTRKLPPGGLLAVRPGEAPGEVRFWASPPAPGAVDPFPGTEEEAAEELDRRLVRVAAAEAEADVPVGIFLSGGIDSSSVAAALRGAGVRMKTFTAAFGESGFDESASARAVALHLGAEHEELPVSAAEALALAPDLASIYDEPFADSSALPTVLLCRKARERVAVCLTGDGGDELFGGYRRHTLAPAVWRRTGFLPRSLRAAAARLLRLPAAGTWEALAGLLPASWRMAEAGAKAEKFALLLEARDRREAYLSFLSLQPLPDGEAAGASEALAEAPPFGRDESFARAMMRCDLSFYLPGDVLAKVDRAAMAAGLETRAPLLHPSVADLALSLPETWTAAGRGKRILRRVLARRVPPALTDRAKAGFATPVGAWLRGPLRPWAEDLLGPALAGERGFRPLTIRRLWSDHLIGRRDGAARLWSLVQLEAWLRKRAEPLSAASAESVGRLRFG